MGAGGVADVNECVGGRKRAGFEEIKCVCVCVYSSSLGAASSVCRVLVCVCVCTPVHVRTLAVSPQIRP